MTEKLQFTPEDSGYTVQHAAETVQVKLDGGAPRTRRDFSRSTSIVSANWLLTPEQHQLFVFFMHDTLQAGSLEFLVDLLLDFQGLVTYKAVMVQGSLRTTEARGLSRRITMRMEVQKPFFWQGRISLNGTSQAITKDQVGKDPAFDDFLTGSDQVRLVGADVVNPAFANGRTNLDGTYALASVDSASQITLTGAEAINPRWDDFTTTISTPVISAPAIVRVPT